MSTGTRLRRLRTDARTPVSAPLLARAGTANEATDRTRFAKLESALYESVTSILPAWAFRAAADPFAYGLMPGAGGYGSATGTVSDRRAGKDVPLVWSELDLRGFRILSRQLCDSNQFAIGFLKLLSAFHIRKGYGWQACLKGAVKSPYPTTGPKDPLVAKAQAILDQWRDANKWPLTSREAFRRWCRDGETFGRFFTRGYGRYSLFRFVNPEQIGSPTGDGDGPDSFGCRNVPGDVSGITHYHLWDEDEPLVGEWVEAGRVIHTKKNVDTGVKRGRPDFAPVVEELDSVRRLLRTMLATAIKQARIAWREKIARANSEIGARLGVPEYPSSGLNNLQPNASDDFSRALRDLFGRVGPNGYTVADRILVEGDREYEPGPTMPGAAAFIQIEQAALRGAGVVWNFPEYFSGDASNNNFASALVSGSPFTVTVESSQYEWGATWERPCAIKALELARDAGLLSYEEWSKLDVEVTEPAVVTADPQKDSQVIAQQLQGGIICLDTARMKLGYDPQHEAEGVKKDKAEAQPAPAPTANPAPAPNGAPPARAGIFESATATKMVTVHRSDGTTFQRQQKVSTDADGSGTPARAGSEPGHEHELADADKADIAAQIDKGLSDLPGGAKPPAGLAEKVKNLALDTALKAYSWAVKIGESKAGRAVAAAIDAVFDGPSDLAKFGYNPTNTSGTASPQNADAVKDALTNHFGVGVSGHLVAKVAATVLAKAITWAKGKLKGKSAEATEPNGDTAGAVTAWADMIAQLLAHLTKELGADGAPDAATVEKNLKGLLQGAK